MKENLKALKKYPIVIAFMVFLMGFAVLDELWPKRDYSEMENRELAQRPQLTLASLLEEDTGETWMAKYNTYTQDQVAFRDEWINLKSAMEAVLLKTENNGVWYGRDDTMFAKALSIGGYFERNLTAIERMCERHPGLVDVMIVPSASLVQADRLPAHAPAADEGACLDELAARLAGKANVYDMRETLGAHKDEYIYYRTDHHWTAEGAYYAYKAYAEAKGLPVFDPDSVAWKTVPDFYGTNYSKARKLGTVPDVIEYPDLPNQLTIVGEQQADGEVRDVTGPLYEESYFATRDKYRAFLRGNHAFSLLEGDGEGSVLVVKDSYANSFVPYLVADYETIAIVDFRANYQRIDDILAAGDYDSVLILYSFQGFSTDVNLASRIAVGAAQPAAAE